VQAAAAAAAAVPYNKPANVRHCNACTLDLDLDCLGFRVVGFRVRV